MANSTVFVMSIFVYYGKKQIIPKRYNIQNNKVWQYVEIPIERAFLIDFVPQIPFQKWEDKVEWLQN